jgi:hypothetical protein
MIIAVCKCCKAKFHFIPNKKDDRICLKCLGKLEAKEAKSKKENV